MHNENVPRPVIISSLIDELKIQSSTNSILLTTKNHPTSYFGLFAFAQIGDVVEVKTLDEIDPESEFDLIIGDFAIGLREIEVKDNGEQVQIRENWLDIVSALRHLGTNGFGLFVLEPSCGQQKNRNRLEGLLSNNGYYLKAIFKTPEEMHYPQTSIAPNLILVSKKPSEKIFISELTNEVQTREVVKAFFAKSDGGELKKGQFLASKDFVGFHSIKIKEQFERLAKQYINDIQATLEELSVEIIPGRQGIEFKDLVNSIYIPRVGNSPVVAKLTDVEIKHQNIYQVALKESVSNEYIASFFQSAVGRLIIDSITTEGIIPHINLEDLKKALVILPSFEEQRAIVSTQILLKRIKTSIDEFENELTLNPKSARSIQYQLEDTLDTLGVLTEVDKVHAIIREGESKTVEFKSSVSFNLQKDIKDSNIETSALKTIVAFLNTDGGTLLIGISDEGEILGVNKEIERWYKNPDKFMLNWKNLLKNRIGEQFYDFIDTKKIHLGDKLVLKVDCKRSSRECYLDQRDFYVRTNPATDKLEGPKLVDYIRNHFIGSN